MMLTLKLPLPIHLCIKNKETSHTQTNLLRLIAVISVIERNTHKKNIWLENTTKNRIG
jgi:hypothetical protein